MFPQYFLRVSCESKHLNATSSQPCLHDGSSRNEVVSLHLQCIVVVVLRGSSSHLSAEISTDSQSYRELEQPATWGHQTRYSVELETNLRQDWSFTISEKAPRGSFRPGQGPSRGLNRDCELAGVGVINIDRDAEWQDWCYRELSPGS